MNLRGQRVSLKKYSYIIWLFDVSKDGPFRHAMTETNERGLINTQRLLAHGPNP